MEQFVFDTSGAPVISVERIGGDLRLSGWDQNQFHAESTDEDTLSAEQRNGEVVLAADSDCTVHVPRGSTLRIVHVGGDAKVKQVEGATEIKFVGGDLMLRNMGSVVVERAGGDLNAKKIAGSLTATAGGDASARGVSGDVTVKAGADLYLRDVGGNVRAGCGSDAVLSTTLAPDKSYEVRAGSDVLCRIAPDTSATFTVKAGSDISVDALGARITGNSRQKTVTLGDGKAQVSLTGGSDVNITSSPAEPETMGEMGADFGIEYGVMAAELAADISERVKRELLESRGEARVDVDDIVARVRREMERATDLTRRKTATLRSRIESKIEAAERKAERMAERAERHAGHAGHADRARRKTGSFTLKFDGGRGFDFSPPPAPVSDEERMAILKMLEQGKISVQEAEMLLAALEGGKK